MMWVPISAEYVRQLAWQVKWQEEKLKGLADKVDAMEKELDELKKNGTVHVDKIEYKFDQLKVDKLEGTLHIGITPDVGKSIDDLVVNQQTVDLTTDPAQQEQQEQPYMDIRASIDHYLRSELPQSLEALESRHGFPLGPEYRQMIVDDIERQVDSRIRHYLGENGAEQLNSAENRADMLAAVTDKVKRDIRSAIDRHFQMMPREQGGEHEA